MDYQKQAKEFCDKYGVRVASELVGHGRYFDNDKEDRDIYQVTVSRTGKPSWSFRFGQSIACSRKGTKKGTPPTEYDILATITKNDPGTFKEFCGEFGYSDDSIGAQKTYFAVQEEWEGCRKMFGDVLEELQEIN